MKKITLITLTMFVGIIPSMQAQGIFNQNKTMIKRCIKQIILLKTYTGCLRKGYRIANDGLHIISDIKNGELGLHSDYYGSLSSVNPKVSHYARVQDILDKAKKITRTCKTTLHKAEISNVLRKSEQEELNKTTNNLLHEIRTDLSRLKLLITDNKLKMTDAERLAAIDKLWQSEKEQGQVEVILSRQVETIIRNRKKAIQESKILNQWYGLPNKNY